MYRYLFFLEQGKISVIHYDMQNKRKLDYEKNKGEKTFPIPNDFWLWWKEAASYSDGEAVDFCFIYDTKEYDILRDEFIQNVNRTECSCWTRSAVKRFFLDILRYSHIDLYMVDGHKVSFHQQNMEFTDNSLRTFYTDLCFIDKKDGEGERGVQREGITPLARYYIELLEAEKNL